MFVTVQYKINIYRSDTLHLFASGFSGSQPHSLATAPGKYICLITPAPARQSNIPPCSSLCIFQSPRSLSQIPVWGNESSASKSEDHHQFFLKTKQWGHKLLIFVLVRLCQFFLIIALALSWDSPCSCPVSALCPCIFPSSSESSSLHPLL